MLEDPMDWSDAVVQLAALTLSLTAGVWWISIPVAISQITHFMSARHFW